MNKKKSILIYVLLVLLVVSQILVVSLIALPWLKIVLSSVLYLAMICILVLTTKSILQAQKKVETKPGDPVALKPVDPTLLDMYAILKIPPQYNADGSLKDMYQLLGINPQYSADGTRNLTIYERLGINPRFTQDGKEVPYVLRIKNRVNSLVKLQAAPLPLVYFPRDKQITGQKPILPEPILTEQKDQAPQLKQIPVVKPPVKKQASKPAGKPAKVNYGGSAQKVSVTSVQKINYKPINIVSEGISTGLSLFTIGNRKPVIATPPIVKTAPPKEAPPVQVNPLPNVPNATTQKPKTSGSIVITIPVQKGPRIEASNDPRKITKKGAEYVEFTSLNTKSTEQPSSSVERS